MVLLSSVLLIVPSIILAFVCAFYSGDIMGILHTNNVQESAEFFGIFMFAFVSLATTIIFGTLLTANGSLKEMNWIAGIALLINIIINLILIPRFYAKGAAIACLATQSFVAIAQIVVSVKLLKLKVNYRVIFLLLIFSAGLLALCILVKSLNIEWYIGFGTIIITGMIFAILIRLLNLKVIYQILKFGDQQ
ncbi:polysaccharide biosynthesis C-terminal domain-containing protein [Bacteroidota bacterium]